MEQIKLKNWHLEIQIMERMRKRIENEKQTTLDMYTQEYKNL